MTNTSSATLAAHRFASARFTRVLTLLATLALASPALAHDGHGAHGFAAGLLHPVTGIDHLLALVAVGWWSAATQGERWWFVPSMFAATMLLGALLGLAGLVTPAIEPMIAITVIAFGALLLARTRTPIVLAMALAAAFALLHGIAHGTEAPLDDATGWIVGMLVATLFLHLAGALCAHFARRRAAWLTPLAGSVGVATGVALVVSSIAG
jgi:urease accessory protein